MPNQQQFDTSLQVIRDIDCKLFVLDYDYSVIDEISGRTESVSINVDADSDIRRTANLSIVLKDDSRQSNANIFYWVVGNPYWFDKYIQIYVAIKDIKTSEYVWVNEGIYMVNAPSISYDATSNQLTFEAVDLMSKLTGLRDGYLEGMTYTVPIGSTITGAVESILQEQKFMQYIIYDPPYNYTPQDINIDAGGTAYDLLCQLRDINANWEMFFDVDGVFHWQQIPSGKVITDPTTGELGEPTPLVDDTVWKKLNVSYNLNTNFEDVKNYIEVLGKTHEPNEYGTVTITTNTLTLKLGQIESSYYDNTWIIGMGVITTSLDDDPEVLATPISHINVYDVNNTSIYNLDISDTPITVGNQYYCIKLTFHTSGLDSIEYLGKMQPRAIAFENNPESPFYVGASTKYTCGTGKLVDFADERELYITEYTARLATPNMILNLSPWCTGNDFSYASIGDTWKFKINVNVGASPILTMSIIMAGRVDTYSIKNLNDELISLDYPQDYLLIATKTGANTIAFHMLYYPIPASKMDMSTSTLLNLPEFNNQVRYVCVGDEYDNIYTDGLVEQRARYEVYLRSRLHDTIQIVAVPIYWLDVNTIISYTLPNNTSETEDLWLIKSINTDISVNGTQTINAMRYYPLYADITLPNLATQESPEPI